MVPAELDHVPSQYAYAEGCRCKPCTFINSETHRDYLARRKANGGPLGRWNQKMPSTITRLRREIGIVVPWRH